MIAVTALVVYRWLLLTSAILGALAGTTVTIQNWPPAPSSDTPDSKEEIRCEIDGTITRASVYRNKGVEWQTGQRLEREEAATYSTTVKGRSSIVTREEYGPVRDPFPFPDVDFFGLPGERYERERYENVARWQTRFDQIVCELHASTHIPLELVYTHFDDLHQAHTRLGFNASEFAATARNIDAANRALAARDVAAWERKERLKAVAGGLAIFVLFPLAVAVVWSASASAHRRFPALTWRRVAAATLLVASFACLWWAASEYSEPPFSAGQWLLLAVVFGAGGGLLMRDAGRRDRQASAATRDYAPQSDVDEARRSNAASSHFVANNQAESGSAAARRGEEVKHNGVSERCPDPPEQAARQTPLVYHATSGAEAIAVPPRPARGVFANQPSPGSSERVGAQIIRAKANTVFTTVLKWSVRLVSGAICFTLTIIGTLIMNEAWPADGPVWAIPSAIACLVAGSLLTFQTFFSWTLSRVTPLSSANHSQLRRSLGAFLIGFGLLIASLFSLIEVLLLFGETDTDFSMITIPLVVYALAVSVICVRYGVALRKGKAWRRAAIICGFVTFGGLPVGTMLALSLWRLTIPPIEHDVDAHRDAV